MHASQRAWERGGAAALMQIKNNRCKKVKAVVCAGAYDLVKTLAEAVSRMGENGKRGAFDPFLLTNWRQP
jgi:hypothetical protein